MKSRTWGAYVQEAAMVKGGITYSLSQVVIVTLSMSLAWLVLSRFTWWA